MPGSSPDNRLARTGQPVEQRGFPHIGAADDSDQRKYSGLHSRFRHHAPASIIETLVAPRVPIAVTLRLLDSSLLPVLRPRRPALKERIPPTSVSPAANSRWPQSRRRGNRREAALRSSRPAPAHRQRPWPTCLPVIRSGKRVIISTGTKNLQEQLFHKDVPFLERALSPDGEAKLSVCYMKDRNNYLCRKKLYDSDRTSRVLSGLERGSSSRFDAIASMGEEPTHTGDRAELAELPEASALWHKLDARADTCLGQKCKEY